MAKPYQEERFEYKGYPCVVLFMPYGFRCGYVGLPKTSRFYDENYDDIPVDCHGGLTYGSKKLRNQTDKDIFGLGFDCGHWGDGLDREKLVEYFSDDSDTQKLLKIGYFDLNEFPILSLERVIGECERIVNQIIELESEEQ